MNTSPHLARGPSRVWTTIIARLQRHGITGDDIATLTEEQVAEIIYGQKKLAPEKKRA
jgi:hypothetical protein